MMVQIRRFMTWTSGAHGDTRKTNPHVDRFAKDAVVFHRAFSHAPGTEPALGSLVTSHDPHETKVLGNFAVLQPDVVTLAEILKGRGYRTAAVVSNFVLSRGSGFEMCDDQRTPHVPEGTTKRMAPRSLMPPPTCAGWFHTVNHLAR